MISAGGNRLVPSLLLVEDMWREHQKLVAGELIAAVPSRELIVFTGTESVGGGAKALREVIEAIHANGKADDLLSKEIIVWRNGHWEKHK